MRGKRVATVVLVAAVAVALFAWPKAGAHAQVAQSSAAGPAVSIVAIGTCPTAGTYAFQPATLTVFKGQTVTWTNTTCVPHTVNNCTPSACSGMGPGTGTDVLNSGAISTTFSHQFQGKGTYLYYCMFHGYTVMHGMITVKVFVVQTKTLPAGTIGTAYTAALKTNGGQSPFHWSLVSGSLPKGLTLSTAGHITGTPTTSGTSHFTVKVTDSEAAPNTLTAQKALAITVS